MFDADKTGMLGLPYGDKSMTISCFYLIPERYGQRDGRIDRQTEFLYQYRASVCWRAIKTSFGCSAPNTRFLGFRTHQGLCPLTPLGDFCPVLHQLQLFALRSHFLNYWRPKHTKCKKRLTETVTSAANTIECRLWLLSAFSVTPIIVWLQPGHGCD